MNWFRWYHGSSCDTKWPWVARRSGQCVGTVVAVWSALLEHASQNEERGSVDGFNCEEIDVLFGYDEGTCASVFRAMCERGVIRDGFIAAWSKRQVKDEGASERKRLQRERERLEALEAAVCAKLAELEEASRRASSPAASRDVTDVSQGVTQCHLEQNREEQNRAEKDNTPPVSPTKAENTVSDTEANAEEGPGRGERRPRKSRKCEYSQEFETFWQAYPNRKAKADAWGKWRVRIREGTPPGLLISAASRYAAECAERCREAQYIMHGSTFLGPHGRWRDYAPAAGCPPDGRAVREEDFQTGEGQVDAKAFERARRGLQLRTAS